MTNPTIHLNPNSDCVVIAPVVERLPKCQVLFWYCRMLDKLGSGCVSFSINRAASDLGVSRSTICRWLKQCAEEHHGVVLFRSVLRSRGGATVYLTSIIKVAASCELEGGLGAIGRVMLKELHMLKYVATEMSLQWCQNIGYYAHKKRLDNLAKEGTFIRPSNIEKPFETSCDTRPHGKSKIRIRADRYWCVSQGFSFAGVSQSYVSKRHGCSVSTTKRRTSNKVRREKGLPLVPKLQIARATDLSCENWPKLASMSCGDEGVQMRRLFNIGTTVFRAEQNIYYLNVDLVQMRNLRRRYGKYKNAA